MAKSQISSIFLTLLLVVVVAAKDAEISTAPDMSPSAITINRSTVPKSISSLFDFCGSTINRHVLRTAVRNILERFSEEGSCSVNVCFALDGSDGVSEERFLLQKRLAGLIASILSAGDSDSFYSGVQYGSTTTPIEPPTERIRLFLKELENVKQVRQSETNVAASLAYCGFQLLRVPTSAIVLLGSGKQNVGADPKIVADQINHPILAISTAGGKEGFGTNVGAGNLKKLFEVKVCDDIAEVITDIFNVIC